MKICSHKCRKQIYHYLFVVISGVSDHFYSNLKIKAFFISIHLKGNIKGDMLK